MFLFIQTFYESNNSIDYYLNPLTVIVQYTGHHVNKRIKEKNKQKKKISSFQSQTRLNFYLPQRDIITCLILFLTTGIIPLRPTQK